MWKKSVHNGSILHRSLCTWEIVQHSNCKINTWLVFCITISSNKASNSLLSVYSKEMIFKLRFPWCNNVAMDQSKPYLQYSLSLLTKFLYNCFCQKIKIYFLCVIVFETFNGQEINIISKETLSNKTKFQCMKERFWAHMKWELDDLINMNFKS